MKFIEKQNQTSGQVVPPRYSGRKLKQFFRLGCAALAVALAVGSVPFLRGFAAGNGGAVEPKVSMANPIVVVNEDNQTVSGNQEVDMLTITNRSILTVTSDAVITMVEGSQIAITNNSVLHLHGTIRGVCQTYFSNATLNIYLCDGAMFNVSINTTTSEGMKNYYGYNAATDGNGTLSVKNGDTEVTDTTEGSSGTTYTYTATPGSSEYNTVIWTKGPGGEEIGRGSSIDVTCEENSHYQVYANFVHSHVLTKTSAKAATCTEDGNIDYWTCSVCNKIFSDEEGTNEISQASTVIAAPGHDWSEWATVTEATETTPGEEKRSCGRCHEEESREIPAQPDDYQFTADSGKTWTKGSTDGMVVVIKDMSGDDTQTFGKFVSVSVDGTALTRDTDYTADPGSIKLTLSPDYLSTLDAGEHTLTVELTVTTLTYTFTVAAPATTETPSTGEGILLISVSIVLMLLAAGGAAYVLIRRRKTAE